MTVSYFIMYEGRAADPAAFFAWCRDRHAPGLAALPGVRSLHLLTRATHDDPFLSEDDGPLAVAHLAFDTPGDLERALASGPSRAAHAAEPPGYDGAVLCQAMATEPFALQGGAAAGDAAAACYFVQYRRPAEDEAAFVAYYRDHHPPLLAALPGIRQVAIYTPMGWTDAPGARRADLMLINLVAFESPDAQNAALHSDSRTRLREDYDRFPPFSGRVSHTAMVRRSIVP